VIRAVLLDLDNTLLDFHLCARQAMQQGFAQVGLLYSEEKFETFTQINNMLWRQIEEGTLTKAELHRVRWQIIFEALGIVYDGEAFEHIFFENLCRSNVKIPGADALLEHLSRKKYLLAAASNAAMHQQTGRLERAGLLRYFSHIFVSEELGAQKPQKAFFDSCFSALCTDLPDLKPSEMILIGDSLTADVAGGHAWGMQTIWFCPQAETESDEDCALRGQADYTVHTLEEICHIL